MNAFDLVRQKYAEIADLSHAAALLSWDQQTYMPPRGATDRGHQLATLSGIIHERLTAPELGDLIEKASGAPDVASDQRAFLRELSFSRERSMKLPAALVKELTLEASKSFEVWTRARKARNFALFQPSLARMIDLTRQAAECWGYKDTPWDALVPDYERGLTAARVEKIFKPLRDATVKLLGRITTRPQVETRFLEQKWSIDAQREFGMRVARDIGYDMTAGRQDIAAHPFCTNFSIGDVRITTRFSETSLVDGLFGIIHECGHALYEQGFNPEDARTPLAQAPGLGIHESQSRFWEVRIAQSEPFWRHYLPIMQQYFPGQLDDVTPGQFYRAVNIIEPDFIRVEADEITYNLHIIIRFELEVRIFRGELSAVDIPAAWNELYKKYLGLDVPDDAKGCLQDVHWAYGSFGYFPTYTLGNIYCAMLVEKMQRDLPRLWSDVGGGRFGTVLGWLRANIHRHGRRYDAPELVERVTGKAITCEPLIKHFEAKYGEIYGL